MTPDMGAATRAALAPSLEHLKTVPDSEDDDALNALFSSGTDATGLPSWPGYYLDWLIAQRIGRDRDLVETAIDELIEQAKAAPPW